MAAEVSECRLFEREPIAGVTIHYGLPSIRERVDVIPVRFVIQPPSHR